MRWDIGARFLFVLLWLLAGKAYAFEDANKFIQDKAKYKVLVFWSQSCPCSRSHVEHLNALSEKFKNVSFYGVITDIFDPGSEEAIKEYYSNEIFKIPLIKDEEQRLVKQYKALKTPHSVVLAKINGDYKILYQGGVTDSRDFSQSTKKFLSENLEALSRQESLKYATGKSLGCYIRRL